MVPDFKWFTLNFLFVIKIQTVFTIPTLNANSLNYHNKAIVCCLAWWKTSLSFVIASLHFLMYVHTLFPGGSHIAGDCLYSCLSSEILSCSDFKRKTNCCWLSNNIWFLLFFPPKGEVLKTLGSSYLDLFSWIYQIEKTHISFAIFIVFDNLVYFTSKVIIIFRKTFLLLFWYQKH